MIFASLLLLAGFVVLIKGADLFVEGAACLARSTGLSSYVVGLTVVAFGTSTPELFVNLPACIDGRTDIALGNVVGSNIANLLLVLGVSALVRPLTLSTGMVWKAIPFCLLACGMLWILASDALIDGAFASVVNQSDGLVLLGFFAVFVAYAASIAAPMDGLPQIIPAAADKVVFIAVKMAVGYCGLLFGGRWIVASAAMLGDMLDIPRFVMGLTVVALGTSLPELTASVMAIRRGHVEVAIGNVLGSSMFNVFFVLGVSALIRPLPVSPAAHVDLGVMTAAGILLFVFLFTGRMRIMDRREGVLMLTLYVGYLIYLLYPVFSPVLPAGTAG